MERSRVGIVIPALNESATVSGVVMAAGQYGIPIVVDDGSTDNTAALARQAGAVVVSHERNLGYDAALNSGFAQAASMGSEVVITLDGDNQHDPRLLQGFIGQIDAGADVVAGIRSETQRFGEDLFALYTRLRFGIKDPLCGLKAYRIGVYRALGHFDSYGSTGTELLIFAARNHYSVRQLPFEVRPRDGEARFGRVLTANYKIIRSMLLSMWRIH